MLKLFFAFALAFSLAACAGLGLNLDGKRVQRAFDVGKEQLESQARAGQITWVEAATKTRELDKYFANRTDLDTRWKYDLDDEEYHSYCIALAERLDRNQITFAQFDASRIERFNAIQTRRQSLNAQQRAIQYTQPAQPQQQPSNSSTGRCLYNPAAQANQICYHMTASGQCVHFGLSCN